MLDRDDQKRYGPDVSRRAFLKGSGVAVATSAIAGAAAEGVAQETKAASKVAPAKPVEITLDVNGKKHTLKVEPRVRLLEALRDDLNLSGCKDVCTTQNCGACTVIIDGKAVYACSRLAIAEQKAKITTVEALTEGKNVDQVITAFVKHDATQCGYCTPGFVVAVRAFLNSHPKANLEEIRKGLGGNICRCGTYEGITQAALELAKGGK